jgi:hypothetical protein
VGLMEREGRDKWRRGVYVGRVIKRLRGSRLAVRRRCSSLQRALVSSKSECAASSSARAAGVACRLSAASVSTSRAHGVGGNRRGGIGRSGGGPRPKQRRKARPILAKRGVYGTACSQGQPGDKSTWSREIRRAAISATPSKATTPAGSMSGSTTYTLVSTTGEVPFERPSSKVPAFWRRVSPSNVRPQRLDRRQCIARPLGRPSLQWRRPSKCR